MFRVVLRYPSEFNGAAAALPQAAPVVNCETKEGQLCLRVLDYGPNGSLDLSTLGVLRDIFVDGGNGEIVLENGEVVLQAVRGQSAAPTTIDGMHFVLAK